MSKLNLAFINLTNPYHVLLFYEFFNNKSWNYFESKKICELKGHMNRVLYMTKSPDENVICSGSGDESDPQGL